jgi:hypothetical protein
MKQQSTETVSNNGMKQILNSAQRFSSNINIFILRYDTLTFPVKYDEVCAAHVSVHFNCCLDDILNMVIDMLQNGVKLRKDQYTKTKQSLSLWAYDCPNKYWVFLDSEVKWENLKLSLEGDFHIMYRLMTDAIDLTEHAGNVINSTNDDTNTMVTITDATKKETKKNMEINANQSLFLGFTNKKMSTLEESAHKQRLMAAYLEKKIVRSGLF